MFYKLFSYLPGYNETSLNIRLSCHDQINQANVVVARKQQSSPEEFKEAEEVFKKRMDIYMNSNYIKINIELEGKLEGKDIKKQFTDLASYHQFLENNKLVNEIEAQKLN